MKITINFNDIIYFDKDKVKYISVMGKEEEILFQNCNANYRKQNSSTVSKCVGVRGITANPPFIGLYSEPPLKILFNSEDEFGEFKNAIHDFDWMTLDLS